MRRTRILVFGGPAYLDPVVHAEWDRAGVELVGPISPSTDWSAANGSPPDGAIIDINLDIETVIGLTDRLDRASIPCLFATSSTVAPGYRGFELGVRTEAINAILMALFGIDSTLAH